VAQASRLCGLKRRARRPPYELFIIYGWGKGPCPTALKVVIAQAGKPVPPSLSWFWVSQGLMNGWFPSSFPGSQAPAWEPPCRQSSCFGRGSSLYCTKWPKQELGNQDKAGCAAFSRLRATHEKARGHKVCINFSQRHFLPHLSSDPDWWFLVPRLHQILSL
jgi:hypothetical protein